MILDEIQYAPDLLPYIKERIDAGRSLKDQYLLSGSQNLLLMQQVADYERPMVECRGSHGRATAPRASSLLPPGEGRDEGTVPARLDKEGYDPLSPSLSRRGRGDPYFDPVPPSGGPRCYRRLCSARRVSHRLCRW